MESRKGKVTINSSRPLPSPQHYVDEVGGFGKDEKQFVLESMRIVQRIMVGEDERTLVVVGPCSIHDPQVALEYAEELKKEMPKHGSLFMVMRVYFEKPRTRTGWKGLIYDPYLDGSDKIDEGLRLARSLLVKLAQMRVPVACEFLDVVAPVYLMDLITWGAIGARTTESQVHRQLASGLDMAIGFKNLTSGSWTQALDGVLASSDTHSFLSTDMQGRVCHVETIGNPYCHVVLRGGADGPNYHMGVIKELSAALCKEGIRTGIMVDASHANSNKNHLRQCLVALYARRLQLCGHHVRGFMVESNINEGAQKIVPGVPLKHGVSVTDACISFPSTRMLLQTLNTMMLTLPRSIDDARNAMRFYDDLLLAQLSSPKGSLEFPINLPFAAQEFHVCFDDAVHELCATFSGKIEELSMLCSQRLSFSESLANFKFLERPFDFLRRTNLLWQVVSSSFSVELDVLRRTNEHTMFFQRLIEISKDVQVQVLEKVLERQRIGYAFALGSITHEELQSFRGIHVFYPSEDAMFQALGAGEIDFCFVPLENSISGTITSIPPGFEGVGDVAKDVVLSVYGNRQWNRENVYIVETLYLYEPIRERVSSYLASSKIKFKRTVPVSSTGEGLLRVAGSAESAITFANTAGSCYLIEGNVAKRNVTTFSLVRKMKKK